MEVVSKLFDKRIKSWNILVEITIRDYYKLVENIIENNEFQRKRVRSSASVYSLLKKDILEGCIIPPIVLALTDTDPTMFDIGESSTNEIIEHINTKKGSLIILDGLQRTYTIRDLISELERNSDEVLEEIYSYKQRVEIYIGIDKIGILYRMLTLNTGQTPMSTRHQIEILYSDYIDKSIDNIRLIKESDGVYPKKGEFKFKDVIEGFNSYIEREYLTLDRTDILDNISSLEKLSKENQNKDLFRLFLTSFNELLIKLSDISDDWVYQDQLDLTGQPLGKDVISLFSKSQALTGFGSAIGKLIDIQAINSLEDLPGLIDRISGTDIQSACLNLISNNDKIRTTAKKIRNDQRLYFHCIFRELFDRDGDCFLNLKCAVDEGYRVYERKIN